MVKNNYGNHEELQYFDTILSNILLSVGVALTIVSTLFFGIKLRWFRYRMKIPHDEESVILRSQSVHEIRENCSVGQYRQSLQEDVMSTRSNDSFHTPSSSSSVKSKSDRRTIFHWPFKNKLTLNKENPREEQSSKRIEIIRSTSAPESAASYESNDKIAHDLATNEKNERIMRSIMERLHSNNSASMPDLVQCDEKRTPPPPPPRKAIAIQQGLVVSLEEESDECLAIEEVSEVESIKSPPEARKVVIYNETLKERENEISHEIEEIVDVRPPTPPRRRSRSNSIKNALLQQQLEAENVPPPVMPRKKHANVNNTVDYYVEEPSESEDEFDAERRVSMVDGVPKSILKTGESISQSNSTVHFINVPSSSSSSEYGDCEQKEEHDTDVWRQIDMHRDQLTQNYRVEESDSDDYYDDSRKFNDADDDEDDDDKPPPLPITPPPKYDSHERDFSFA